MIVLCYSANLDANAYKIIHIHRITQSQPGARAIHKLTIHNWTIHNWTIHSEIVNLWTKFARPPPYIMYMRAIAHIFRKVK